MANLVDSSVWVALYRELDTQHDRAVRLVPRLRGPIYLPYGVLEETASILTYKHSKAQADQFLNHVQDNRDIVFLDGDCLIDTVRFRATAARISFVDAILIGLAKALPAKLITFDKQLERLAKK